MLLLPLHLSYLEHIWPNLCYNNRDEQIYDNSDSSTPALLTLPTVLSKRKWMMINCRPRNTYMTIGTASKKFEIRWDISVTIVEVIFLMNSFSPFQLCFFWVKCDLQFDLSLWIHLLFQRYWFRISPHGSQVSNSKDCPGNASFLDGFSKIRHDDQLDFAHIGFLYRKIFIPFRPQNISCKLSLTEIITLF